MILAPFPFCILSGLRQPTVPAKNVPSEDHQNADECRETSGLGGLKAEFEYGGIVPWATQSVG